VNISLKIFHFDTLGNMILEDDFRRQFDAIIATVPKNRSSSIRNDSMRWISGYNS